MKCICLYNEYNINLLCRKIEKPHNVVRLSCICRQKSLRSFIALREHAVTLPRRRQSITGALLIVGFEEGLL
jgi:hypothetical protein